MDDHDGENTDGIPASLRKLSPLRNSTTAQSVSELVAEQLAHFGIDGQTRYGQILG